MEKISLIFFLFVFQSCNHLFFFPTRDVYIDLKKRKITYQEFEFPSLDGTKLNGILMLHKGNKKTKGLITFFHGNGENLTSHVANFFWLLDYPYDVFIADYRGYGKSSGEASLEGALNDSASMLLKAEEIQSKNKIPHLITYGQSLGGVLMLEALLKSKMHAQVDLIVLDSTFLSYQEMANATLKRSAITYLFSPLSYLLISDHYSPKKNVKNLKIKRALVIHGKKDSIVPFRFGEENYHLLVTDKKDFWPIENGEHIDVFFREKRYKMDFVKLLNSL